MRLSEIGSHVHNNRLNMGLTQGQLAKLAGLSRTTVNQLENGNLDDIGYSRLSNLLSILGASAVVLPSSGLDNALVVAARSISTSYSPAITPEDLAKVLTSGEVPDRFCPHIITLLDETPLPVVIKAINQVANQSPPYISSRTIFKNMANFSKQLNAHRKVWT